jgi:hypothetical protein
MSVEDQRRTEMRKSYRGKRAPAENAKPAVPIVGNDAPFLIGGAKSCNGTLLGQLNGFVDEVELYNHVLLDSQVQYLFEHPTETVAGPLSDMNCDDVVSLNDIDAFVELLGGQ